MGRRRYRSRQRFDLSLLNSIVVLSMAVLMVLSLGLPVPAQSIPPDPERPNNSTTCGEALARVREAAVGNPLVSVERNRELLLEAIGVAERLCLGK